VHTRRLVPGLCLLLSLLGLQGPAFGASCAGGAAATGNTFAAGMGCTRTGAPQRGSKDHVRSIRDQENAPSYEWRNPCGPGLNGDQAGCARNNCPPGERTYRLWRVAPPPATPMGLVCSGNGPPPVAAAPPQVTDAMVLQAFRRIPLPSLRSQSQPANKTLINFDTIFFTQAQPLTRQLTLLGQRVRLEIRPSRFEWVHGDGTTKTTTTPGAPYPAKTIVYRYADAHRTVAHRVVVTWSAEWSLNGGPLQPVNGTVTTTGPSTPLRIAEASPALSGSGH
jgi:hypothetical protein